jgi:hypothetical protein
MDRVIGGAEKRKLPKEGNVHAKVPKTVRTFDGDGDGNGDGDGDDETCVWRANHVAVTDDGVAHFVERCRTIMCVPGIVVQLPLYARAACFAVVLGPAEGAP